MDKKKNIRPHNDKGQAHGYWENFYPNGNVDWKCNFINGKAHGYWEEYYVTGKPLHKGYIVNSKRVGLWFLFGDEKRYYI